MVECPKCGNEAGTPVKTWSISSRKTVKSRDKPSVIMGIFDCPDCGARFRARVPTEPKIEDIATIKNIVEKIKGVKGELMQTLKELRGKIKNLETERANLMLEIEKLKKMADSKVVALESEVSMLRDEVESLRELLGYAEEPDE